MLLYDLMSTLRQHLDSILRYLTYTTVTRKRHRPTASPGLKRRVRGLKRQEYIKVFRESASLKFTVATRETGRGRAQTAAANYHQHSRRQHVCIYIRPSLAGSKGTVRPRRRPLVDLHQAGSVDGCCSPTAAWLMSWLMLREIVRKEPELVRK